MATRVYGVVQTLERKRIMGDKSAERERFEKEREEEGKELELQFPTTTCCCHPATTSAVAGPPDVTPEQQQLAGAGAQPQQQLRSSRRLPPSSTSGTIEKCCLATLCRSQLALRFPSDLTVGFSPTLYHFDPLLTSYAYKVWIGDRTSFGSPFSCRKLIQNCCRMSCCCCFGCSFPALPETKLLNILIYLHLI